MAHLIGKFLEINFNFYYILYKPKFSDSPPSLPALSVAIHKNKAIVPEVSKAGKNAAQVYLCYTAYGQEDQALSFACIFLSFSVGIFFYEEY